MHRCAFHRTIKGQALCEGYDSGIKTGTAYLYIYNATQETASYSTVEPSL